VRFTSLGDGIVAKNWMILGPFGGPGTEAFGMNPHSLADKKAVIDFYEKAEYPPDNNIVNPAEKFSGELIHGYWGKPREIGWRKASVADLDVRVDGGAASQAWYGATWIWAPANVEVEVEFSGHLQTYIRWFINGDPFEIAFKEYRPGVRTDVPRTYQGAIRTVWLKAGWNQVSWRTYSTGYAVTGAPFRIGLTVRAKDDVLWKLKFSGEPPKK